MTLFTALSTIDEPHKHSDDELVAAYRVIETACALWHERIPLTEVAQ